MNRYALLCALAVSAPSLGQVGPPRGEPPCPITGLSRVVIRFEQGDRVSHITTAFRASSELTDFARAMMVHDEDYEYRFTENYRRIERPSREMFCAGDVIRTIWPDAPRVRLNAPDLGAQLLIPFGAAEPLSDTPQVGDIIWWAKQPPGPGKSHVSVVTQVTDDRMIIRTKDTNESIFALSSPHDPKKLSNKEVVPGPHGGNEWLETDILLRRYGGAWRHRLPPGITMRWFWWTPNWSEQASQENPVNGIDLGGTWQKRGEPDVRFTIVQRRMTSEYPLVVKSADGSKTAYGTFEHGGALLLAGWGESGEVVPRHRATFTADRIDFIANPMPAVGTTAETWQRVPDAGHVTYVGTWFDTYVIEAPTETETARTEIREATGGRSWHFGQWHWLEKKTTKNVARITVDTQSGRISGELEYRWTEGGAERTNSIDLSRQRIDPVAFINRSGLEYVKSHALRFSRGVGIQPPGWPDLQDDFVLADFPYPPTEQELRSGTIKSHATPFAVLWRGSERPSSRTEHQPPQQTESTVEQWLAQGEPAVYVRDIRQDPDRRTRPMAVEGTTGRRDELRAGQVLSRNSLIETKGARVRLAIVLPGTGGSPPQEVLLDLLDDTEFDAGNFIANVQTLDLMLSAGTAELTDTTSLALAARLIIRLSTPRVALTHVGTRYRVHHDPATGHTVVQVIEGTVRCTPTNPPGPPITLTAGQQVIAGASGLGPVTGIDPLAIPGAGATRGAGPAVAGGLPPGGPGGTPNYEPPPEGSPAALRHALVYHQITTDAVAFSFPVISAQGNRIVYAPDAYPCPVQVVDFDGTNRRTVMQTDRVPTYLDISDDGSRIMIVHERREILVANADGSGRRQLLQCHDPEITFARISGDGRQVFFFLGRPTRLPGSSAPSPPGLWAIDADGTGLRLVVGPEPMRRLLGIAGDEGVAWRQCLDVSHDASRLVFGAVSYSKINAGPKICTVRGDGSDLRLVAEAARDSRGGVGSAVITPDGRRIAYKIAGWGEEALAGSAAWDGSDARVLSRLKSSRYHYPDGNSMVEPMSLSRDGAWLLLGSTGILVTTDGRDLAYHLPATRPGAGKIILSGSLTRASMDGDARRFSFLCGDERNRRHFQLATLEVGPPDTGAAPRIDEVRIEPPYIVPEKVGAIITARVQSPGELVVVTDAVLREGFLDSSISAEVLADDGRPGCDEVVGDGIFSAPIVAPIRAEQGPRQVRVDAEARGGDGRRHATAIDIGPAPVTAEPPPRQVASAPPPPSPPVEPATPPTGGSRTPAGGAPPPPGGASPPGGGASPPTVEPGLPPVAAAGMRLEAERRRVGEDDLVMVPVWLKDAVDVANVNFEVHYDASVARPEGDVLKGNLLDRAIFSANPRETGRLRVGFARTGGLNGTGTVAYLPMRAVGRAGDETPLRVMVTTIDNPQGSTLAIQRIDGSILIVGPEGQVPGDCDGDGAITAADAMCALKMSVGNMAEIATLDVDDNGSVTSGDARILLKRAVGIGP